MRKKILYLIPGYGGSCKGKKGREIASIFEKKGFDVRCVSIAWNAGKKPVDFDSFVKDFLSQYEKTKGAKTYILGFSFGAMIAFLAASKAKPDGLILCSLSPYFKEDLSALKPSWVRWWEKASAKRDISFNRKAPGIRTKTIIVVGNKEGAECEARAKEAHRRIKGSRLLVIKGALHDIASPAYKRALSRLAP